MLRRSLAPQSFACRGGLCAVLTAAASLVAMASVVAAAAGIAVGAGGETAVATLKLADGKELGQVSFTEAPAGVLIKLELTGVPPGAHGLRIHEVGACEGDFSSAGAIYNPLGAQHGFFNDEGPMAGDLPNVYAAADGTLMAEILSATLSLSKDAEDGIFDADGTALVLTTAPDDYLTDPDGNAGARIACGKIEPK